MCKTMYITMYILDYAVQYVYNKHYHLSICILNCIKWYCMPDLFNLFQVCTVEFLYAGICSIVEMEDEPKLKRLRDYENWESLSLAEKSKLIKLCERLHPSVLESMYYSLHK